MKSAPGSPATLGSTAATQRRRVHLTILILRFANWVKGKKSPAEWVEGRHADVGMQ
jgi:hypothetical protein